MRATFEEYQARYADFAVLSRDEGLLEIRLHRDNGPCVFDGHIHGALGDLFEDVGSDPANRTIILTATGDRFLLASDMDMSVMEAFLPYTANLHLRTMPESMRLIENFLKIEVPVIAAINGPVTVHAEIPVLADIVLASQDCYLADPFHFRNGIVPGDGVQVIWPIMMGLNRARHFLLTGSPITSQKAEEIGFVNEVLPGADLMARAREIGRSFLRQPDVTLRATRMLFTRTLKRAISEDLPFGLALEGLGNSNHWPLAIDS
jgi:enoyl-CoA hydratase/carnithine racemase